MNASDNVWDKIKYDLSLQMTTATFDTWLRNSRLISEEINRLTVAVANHFALDWLSTRLNDTVLRTAARTLGRPVEVQFIVSDDGQEQPGQAEPDVPTDSPVAIEIVNLDITIGFVMTSNYAWGYWQPYLAAIERENGALTPIAFCLWNTLRSFPAAWQQGRPQWPSIFTLADMVARGNRHKVMGRNERGRDSTKRPRMVGALEILENEHIVWPRTVGTGRDTVYYFRVLDSLPILTPAQIGKLSERLQERHERELERRKLDFIEWQQLTLPTLLEDH